MFSYVLLTTQLLMGFCTASVALVTSCNLHIAVAQKSPLNNWNLKGKKSKINSHGKHMFTQSHNQFI